MWAHLKLRIPARLSLALREQPRRADSLVESSRITLAHLTSRYRSCVPSLRDDTDQASIEQHVRNALIDAQIGNLYAQVFRKEWRASTQSTRIDREPCERANELLTHMSRILPVDDMAMGWDIDERPVGIPVWRLSVPFDEEWTEPDALASRSTSELVMACLLGVYGSEDVQAYLADERQFPYAFPEPHEGEYVEAAAFRRACRRRTGGQWHKLADAIWTVGHSTGNFMLDYDDDTAQYFWEQVEKLGWTVKGYRRLKQECERGEALLKTLADVCAWLDEEPQHWSEVFVLWAMSYQCRVVKRHTRRPP